MTHTSHALPGRWDLTVGYETLENVSVTFAGAFILVFATNGEIRVFSSAMMTDAQHRERVSLTPVR